MKTRESRGAVRRFAVVTLASLCLPRMLAAEVTPREITVLSWNTEHYNFKRWSAAEQRELEQNMFDLIRVADPDIVLIQETYGSFERFKAAFPRHNAVLQSECNAVFSKFPIRSSTRLWVDRKAKEPLVFNTPTLAVADVMAGALHLRVSSFAMFWLPICVHTPPQLSADELMAWERAPQPYPLTSRPQAIAEVLAALSPFLVEKDRIPLIIGGDFNSMSHLDWTQANGNAEGHGGRVVPWAVSTAMAKAGFVDSYRAVHRDEAKEYGVTCPMAGCDAKQPRPRVRLDYVYSAGATLKPIASEAILGTYHKPFTWRGKTFSMFPSDHAAVLTRFAVATPGAASQRIVPKVSSSQTSASLVAAAQVTTPTAGWVFTETQTLAFDATNDVSQATWSLADWRGRACRSGPWPKDGKLRLDPLVPGYYRVTSASAAGDAPKPFAFCVVRRDPCRNAGSFFAADAAFSQCSRRGEFLCPWRGGDSYAVTAQLLGKCGVVHTRERMVWNRMEPKRGQYDFSLYLDNARKLKANGVVSTGLFGDTPGWMARRGKRLPGDLVATYRFTEAAARTFEPYYDAWEFWNEQELGSTIEPVWEYVAALKAFALGARAGSDTTVILPGSLSNIEHFGYGQAMFDSEIAKYVQAFNLHTYHVPAGLARWHRDVRKFLEEAGVPDWQVWLTESGTDLESHAREQSVMPRYKAHAPQQEMVVAEFAAKSAALQRFGGIYRNWFFLFGAYSERHGEKDWGSMRRDGSAKPVMAVLSTLAGELGDADMLGEVSAGEGVRAFLYAHPDGKQTLMAWSQSAVDLKAECRPSETNLNVRTVELRVPDGTYAAADMMGMPSVVRAEGGRLRMEVTRYPQFVSGALGLKADTPAASTGRLARYVPRADEDLSVVIRPEVSPADFAITGRKCVAELEKERGTIRLEVWNLSPEAKRGRLAFSCGTVTGGDDEIALPAWGMKTLSVTWTPPSGDALEFALDIAGTFNGKRISRMRIPMSYRWRFLSRCTAVPLDALNHPKGWRRNDSADTYACVYDEQEKATRFDVAWGPNKPAWFFPVHVLKMPEESLAGAKYIEFEVKTSQDKVENDFGDVLVMALCKDGSVPYLPYQRPGFEWEKRRVRLPAKPEEIAAFRLGGTPRGRRLTFWVRNVRILK